MTFDTIILDLDNCLINSTLIHQDSTMHYAEMDGFFMTDFHILDGPQTLIMYHVHKRKHLDHFITELIRMKKRIIIWSSGLETYVKTIANILFEPHHLHYVLTRKNLLNGKKNLSVLGMYIDEFDLEQSVLIDDKETNGSDYPKNLITINPFHGNDDDELLRILKLISE